MEEFGGLKEGNLSFAKTRWHECELVRIRMNRNIFSQAIPENNLFQVLGLVDRLSCLSRFEFRPADS